jgi:EpsI family protein
MRRSILFAATTFLLLATIFGTKVTARRIPEPLTRPLETIDATIEGWSAVKDRELDATVLKALLPTSYLSRTYQKGRSSLDLFIGFYAQQRAGESMHSPKHCLPGAGWEIWQHGSATIPVGSKSVEVNKYSIQNSGTRMLMFYWYQSSTRIVASEYLGKVLLARDTFLTGRTGGSIVRIMVMDEPGAEQEGIAFASKLIPEVQECLGSPNTSIATSLSHN